MNVQLAEVSRKPALLLGGERLSAEEQNLVFDQQFTEALDRLLRQFFGEPDAIDNGSEGGGNALNGNGHGRRLLRWLTTGNAGATTLRAEIIICASAQARGSAAAAAGHRQGARP
jgi:hypothetical protein